MCADRDLYTDNDAENIFIEAIKTFSPLRLKSIEDFLKEFQKERSHVNQNFNKIQLGKYNSLDYQSFVHTMIKKTEFKNFSLAIPPSFRSLFNMHLEDKPEYNLLMWALPYLRPENKFLLIGKILLHAQRGLAFKEVEEFIDHYLAETLVNTTNRLVEYLLTHFDGTMIKYTDIVIDKTLKNQAINVKGFYSKKEYRDTFKSELMDSLKKTIPSDKLKPDDYKGIIISRNNLLKWNEKQNFNFLFNTLEFRNYYWKRFFDPEVQYADMKEYHERPSLYFRSVDLINRNAENNEDLVSESAQLNANNN